MRYLVFILLLAIVSYHECAAQKRIFVFDSSIRSSGSHAVGSFTVIDQREDSFLFPGFASKCSLPITEKQEAASLPEALQGFYTRTYGTADTGFQVIIVLRHFYTYDVAGAFSEKTFFVFKADYFLGNDDPGYRLGAQVDTVLQINATQREGRMSRGINQALCDFYNTMDSSVTTAAYSYPEILDFDATLKKKTPCYTTAAYTTAAYRSWEQFRWLQAMEHYTIIKERNSFKFSFRNTKGREFTGPLNCKIFSSDNQPYYVSGPKYYPMEKKDGNFFISAGYDLLGNSPNDAVTVGALTGGLVGAVIGGVIADNVRLNRKPLFKYKINHRNGKLIPVTE